MNEYSTINFVLSANPGIGYGHMYRCLELAQHFMKCSCKVNFNMPIQDEVFIKNIKSDVSFCWISDFSSESVSKSLGKQRFQSIVVIDSYLQGKELEANLRAADFFVVAIDDLGRDHQSNMIVDSCLDAAIGNKYKTSFDTEMMLLGPSYSIIREEFKAEIKFDFERIFCDVLIFLGTTTSDLTLKLLESVRSLSPQSIKILAPMQNDFNERLLKENESIIYKCDDMLSLYKSINMCFGACGVSQVERFALGVPSVCFKTIDNQENNAVYIANNNLAPMLGDLSEIKKEELRDSLLNLKKLTSHDWKKFSTRALNTMNVNGAELIVENILMEFKKFSLRTIDERK